MLENCWNIHNYNKDKQNIGPHELVLWDWLFKSLTICCLEENQLKQNDLAKSEVKK